MLILRKPPRNQHAKRRFRPINVAMSLTAAAILVNLLAANIQEPADVRGWYWYPLSDFITTGLAALLPIAAIVAWIAAGAWAIWQIGSDFQDW